MKQQQNDTDLEEAQKLQRDLLENLKKTKFNPIPIAHFLCRHFNKPNLTAIANQANGVFGTARDAWSLFQDVSIGLEVGTTKNGEEFTFDMSKDAEAQCIHCPFQPQHGNCRFLDNPDPQDMLDLSRVCIYSMVHRHEWSTLPINVFSRVNYYHKGIDEIQQLAEKDAMYQAAGIAKGAVKRIKATPMEGIEVDNMPLPELGFGPSNREFTRTMGFITRENLMNGIVRIPREVCEEARLPLCAKSIEPQETVLTRLMENMDLKTDDEKLNARKELVQQFQEHVNEAAEQRFKDRWSEKERHKLMWDFYYAVPVMHVLAWILQSEDYALQKDIYSQMLRFTPPQNAEPIVLYYLVPDKQFDNMLAEFYEGWMDKVDMRPLSKVAIEYVPELNRSLYPHLPAETRAVQGCIKSRIYVKYLAPPRGLTEADVRQLAPTLAPGMLSSQAFVDERVQMEMALQKHQERLRAGK